MAGVLIGGVGVVGGIAKWASAPRGPDREVAVFRAAWDASDEDAIVACFGGDDPRDGALQMDLLREARGWEGRLPPVVDVRLPPRGLPFARVRLRLAGEQDTLVATWVPEGETWRLLMLTVEE